MQNENAQILNHSRIEIIKTKIIKLLIVTRYLNLITEYILSYPILTYNIFCYLDSIMQIFYIYE